jgi:hypothetical protein
MKHAYNTQRVWEAAYAAAFVNQVNRIYSMLSANDANDDAFNIALARNELASNAKAAITIADEAVRQLDAWVEQEES